MRDLLEDVGVRARIRQNAQGRAIGLVSRRQRLRSKPRERGGACCGQLEQNDVEPIVQVGAKLTTLNQFG